LIRIDNESPKPIYEQIYDEIIRLIFSKSLKPDEKLPSVRELASMIRINPNTIQKAYKYLEGIINLFTEEKYRCSAEGHVSHILSARLSSRPMGWSIIGADEMARMRTYKANGGSIKEYYRKLRAERKKEERILELDKKVVKDIKRTFNTIDPDIMIDMPYINRTDGRWLKNMINCSGF
jgi:DNA-binding transcriptional MocR family regulator